MELLQENYFWPRIKETVEIFFKNCHFCSTTKRKSIREPIIKEPRERLQFDISKLPKDSHGYVGFISAIDCHIKYFRIRLIKDEKADEVADFLNKISAPDEKKPWKKSWKVYQSDNEKNLNAKEVDQIIEKVHGKHINFIPYNPSING